MTQIIPVTNYPEQVFRITLDGVTLAARVWWSEFDQITRDMVGDDITGQWYWDMVSTDGAITVYGMALVTGCDMFEPYAFEGLGGLWLVSLDASTKDPELQQLGETYQLIYVPAAEVDEFNEELDQLRFSFPPVTTPDDPYVGPTLVLDFSNQKYFLPVIS